MAESRTRVPLFRNSLSAARRLLVGRHLPAALAVLGMVLTAPSIRKGLVADDLIHRAKLLTSGLPDALTGLFAFIDRNNVDRLMDSGAGPWWGLESLRISFFRPVTAFTHWLDYHLWPSSPALMHVHNILWYGALCLLVAYFFRRMMNGVWVAGLAAFLFTVDDAHTVPVMWLANRNALVALFFGLLAVSSHDRWRREGRRLGSVLASLWLILSVLSAEIGVATVAYLMAYEVCLDRAPWRERLMTLAPYFGVVVVWQVAYHQTGYGAWGSAYYVDPGREPLRFAAAVVERGPILLVRQWLWPYPTLYNMLSKPASHVFWLVGLVVIAAVLVALIPLMRSDATARFWGIGMLLAVVPVCAKDSADGATLMFVGVGAMGLAAQFLGGLFDDSGWLPVRRGWRVAAWALGGLLIVVHCVHAPIQLVVASVGPDPFETAVERFSDIGPIPNAARRDAVIVNAPSPLSFGYLEELRSYRGLPMPAHVRILAPGYYSVEVRRLDSCTVVVRPENGFLVTPGGAPEHGRVPFLHPIYIVEKLDRACRSGRFPMRRGQKVELTNMTVEVTDVTGDGRPSEAQFRFTRSLDDPALVWLQWDWKNLRYAPLSLPRVGGRMRIPGVL